MDSRSVEVRNYRQEKGLSHCLISLPTLALLQAPFLRHPSKANNLQLLEMAAESSSHIVSQLQDSIVSTREKCLRFLQSFAAHNPFVNKLLSFPSHLQSFCQIPHRNFRNLGTLSNHNFAAILPGDSVAGVVVANGILNFLNIYNTLLVVRLILTWFPNAPPAVVSPLSTLCDPYLNIFRGLIPPLGGTLDLSPILAFLVLNAFTSTAAALPAELPPAEFSSQGVASDTSVSSLTASQEKWMRRLAANRPKCSGGEI